MLDIRQECKDRGYLPTDITIEGDKIIVYVPTDKRLTQITLGKWWDGDEFECVGHGNEPGKGFYFRLRIIDKERS